MKISGKFDVSLKPIESYAQSKDGINIGRMSIDKTYFGPLSATSKGEMLSAVSSVPGAAGYVAMELVTGELDGKTGSFALQHFGTMNGEEQHLILEVVPHTGTGELESLNGKMNIIIKDKVHYYEFDYQL